MFNLQIGFIKRDVGKAGLGTKVSLQLVTSARTVPVPFSILNQIRINEIIELGLTSERVKPKMTYNQMTPAIGSAVDLRCEDLWVRGTVVDAKNAYGRVRLLFQPAAGSGQQWVELHRLRLVRVQEPMKGLEP